MRRPNASFVTSKVMDHSIAFICSRVDVRFVPGSRPCCSGGFRVRVTVSSLCRGGKRRRARRGGQTAIGRAKVVFQKTLGQHRHPAGHVSSRPWRAGRWMDGWMPCCVAGTETGPHRQTQKCGCRLTPYPKGYGGIRRRLAHMNVLVGN